MRGKRSVAAAAVAMALPLLLHDVALGGEKPELVQTPKGSGVGRDMVEELMLRPEQEAALREHERFVQEEKRRVALEEEEKRRKAEEAEERSDLVEESVESLLPLRPGEVRDYLRRKDELEAVSEPVPANMRTQTRELRPVPGAVPQVIRLTSGYSSTLLFQDRSGAPWPVLSVVVGNSKAFAVSRQRAAEGAKGEPKGKDVGTNLLTLVPLSAHASSNLVVTLDGAPYPVLLHLLTESPVDEGRINDALVVFQVDALGPNAKIPKIGPDCGAVSGELLSFVHGVAPEGARRLALDGAPSGTELWEFGGEMFLRTPHQAVWPAWKGVAGGEGLRVYIMPKTSSVVLLASGKRVRASVVDSRREEGR